MKPIRVLQVVTIMNRGGLETMLMNYYRKIDRTKIQFDFMTHRTERGHYDDEIEKLGGKIYRMSSIRPGNYNKYFKELDDFFNEHKDYKIVHSHINENSGFVLKAANKYNVPCRIAHSHLADLKLDYKYPFRIYARLNLEKNVNEYFSCSKNAGEWLFGRNISENGKIKILNNAVDVEIFKPKDEIRSKIRKELGVEGKFVIGHIGRFYPQKNHKFLIDVFNEIYALNKDAILLLVGEGPLLDDIKAKVISLGLQNVVKFLGIREDVANFMQGMDLFLFPSLFEGLAVVLVEAQASGTTCVTSTGVTKESNITGDVEFIDLNLSAKKWANKILALNLNKKDTSDLLKIKGYDSNTNVNWLSDFYLKYVQRAMKEVN
ncbi:glycosyltransferase family 1 protein [Clostridium tarantellae]|uniref:Glycosyltransferase n=1 Tax=Clostridium tarantellae TaxID=39493 RepID=A0A6I1MG07_9CLOT|nr:glycosyltransferase family 1 protein [Clostridium tarantellae]MPQ42295.1 glycosyltransferase [Clostridium tarantellae]